MSGGWTVVQAYGGKDLGVGRGGEPPWLRVGEGPWPRGRWNQKLVICTSEEESKEVRTKDAPAKVDTEWWRLLVNRRGPGSKAQ
ncbi:hypothetical protein NDU88_005268 [Pleurodeles waltl]|uniref:Uncharacterized protein n=1 Tax=Pleurodeles waltl TaxID=8319 RepID=A0AAV7TV53_PLEWA|nr:hypothetical protein NDU88_005268 [Pleurodeles waltl]